MGGLLRLLAEARQVGELLSDVLYPHALEELVRYESLRDSDGMRLDTAGLRNFSRPVDLETNADFDESWCHPSHGAEAIEPVAKMNSRFSNGGALYSPDVARTGAGKYCSACRTRPFL